MKLPMLTVMSGLPRSGKSTWIQQNKTKHTVVISNDWIRENILHCKYARSINPAIWMITDATARQLLSQGFDVIMDGIHLQKYIRKEIIDMGREMNAKIRIVYMDTPINVCLDRELKMPHDKLMVHAENTDIPTESECDELIFVNHVPRRCIIRSSMTS